MACMFPYYVKNPKYPCRSSDRHLPVPCGKCPVCLKRHALAWSFRLMKQDEISVSSSFVTLTYADENLPRTAGNFSTLEKPAVQLFMKRLRKLHPRNVKLSYYAVGEYGSRTMRPHYHLILFNADKNLIEKAWLLGEIHIGDVTGASIGYVTKYLHKGRVVPVHKNDDRLPEFSLMSKKLGANYLTDTMKNWHNSNLTRNYVIVPGGGKIALPRYYRDKIYTDDQKAQQAKLIAEAANAAEATRQSEYKQKHGSLKNYDRDQFEAKKAEIINYKKRNKLNRKTI